jgi:hypothetical protein
LALTFHPHRNDVLKYLTLLFEYIMW